MLRIRFFHFPSCAFMSNRYMPGRCGVDPVPDPEGLQLIIYPNPSLHKTQLEIFLSVDSRTNLKIFDINGRLISHEINGAIYGKGYHKWELDPSSFPKGIYIVELRAVNTVEALRWVRL